MAFGLGVLRLSPDAFWELTLQELVAVTGAMPPALGAPTRGRLGELMKRFPDGGEAGVGSRQS
jgi:uncharacterized phage protein (TIGR02216 family)